MFSDTHFHFDYLTNDFLGSEILYQMAKNDCFFGLDIGTCADDLISRQKCVENQMLKINDEKLQNKVNTLIYFSAGIWPSVDEINNRENRIKILIDQIHSSQKQNNSLQNKKIIAIGECGLDHHWNPSGVDERTKEDFSDKVFLGERELFEMQLELAKKMDLPVIIHSRDAFNDTFDCIKNIGYDNGIIHCFSYQIEQARQFLDRGWYISFSGSVTYTKKNNIEKINELLNFVPSDKILCETDSPYLSPVPFRGQKNQPNNVKYVYEYIANAKKMPTEELSNIVDKNIKELFFKD